MKNIKLRYTLLIPYFVCFFLVSTNALSNAQNRSLDILKVGKPLPDAKLKAKGSLDVDTNDLKGKIKIISIVPKLNTPVCDKQTHKFSETNGGLDRDIDIITLSTNPVKDQAQFAKKARIKNLIFLSDNPEFLFGKNTG